jgi:hypothetical protein
MEPSIVLVLLIAITVSASTHPLEALVTTTSPSPPDNHNKVQLTVPSGVASSSSKNHSQAPSGGENRLEITLKMDESDKEVITDTDMGKYLKTAKLVGPGEHGRTSALC